MTNYLEPIFIILCDIINSYSSNDEEKSGKLFTMASLFFSFVTTIYILPCSYKNNVVNMWKLLDDSNLSTMILFISYSLNIAIWYYHQLYYKLQLGCINVIITLFLFHSLLQYEIIDKAAQSIDIVKYDAYMNAFAQLLICGIMTLSYAFFIYRNYEFNAYENTDHQPMLEPQNDVNIIPNHVKTVYIHYIVSNNEQCIICLGNYGGICDVHVLDCGHHYHHNCFNKWRKCAYKCVHSN